MADFPALRNASILLVFPFYDGSGCPVKGGGGLAACVSQGGGAFAAASRSGEMAEINAGAGVYKLELTDDEMDADVVAWKAISTTASARDTIGVIYTAASRQLKDLAYPNVAGRGMDVDTAGGVEVGSLGASTIVASTFAANAIHAAAVAASTLAAAKFASCAIAQDIFTVAAGSKVWDAAVRTITGEVTVGTNNDKTGYVLAASSVAASTFALSAINSNAFAITAGCKVWDAAVRTITGDVTVGTNNDKTGYALAASSISTSTLAACTIDSNSFAITAGCKVWDAAVRTVTGLPASGITTGVFTDAAASKVADIALNTITLSELAVGQPATTPTVAEALMFPYMALRNTASTFSGCIKVTNDAGTVVASAAISDNASVFERGKWVSG